jgi:hypothetical protein
MLIQEPGHRQHVQDCVDHGEESHMSTGTSVTAPKIGEHVKVGEQDAVLEVSGINSLMQTANLKSTDGKGHVTYNVPWTSLKPAAKRAGQ